MRLFGIILLFFTAHAGVRAQDVAPAPKQFPLPLTVTVFSEAISLPDFNGFFKSAQMGVRLGTELYYRNKQRSQVFQTINIGYYYHKSLHHGLYISSEVGYRKYLGPFFLDGTLGGGYLHLISTVPVYKPIGGGEFSKASAHFHKFMPTLGLGMGFKINHFTSVFARYEVFGEMPIQQSVPVLPHKAFHLGIRTLLPTI